MSTEADPDDPLRSHYGDSVMVQSQEVTGRQWAEVRALTAELLGQKVGGQAARSLGQVGLAGVKVDRWDEMRVSVAVVPSAVAAGEGGSTTCSPLLAIVAGAGARPRARCAQQGQVGFHGPAPADRHRAGAYTQMAPLPAASCLAGSSELKGLVPCPGVVYV